MPSFNLNEGFLIQIWRCNENQVVKERVRKRKKGSQLSKFWVLKTQKDDWPSAE